jgi:hypothetical protein
MLMIEHTDVVPGLDDTTITVIFRKALGTPTANVHGGWSLSRLGDGGGRTAGVYHLTGQARDSGVDLPWSVVLKVLPAAGEAAPQSWQYPPREALAYRSGLLATVPAGIEAPRCLGVAERPDRTTWLWLEAVVDEQPGPWSLDRHARAAHRLGQFNGVYLVGEPLLDAAWLDHRMIRDQVKTAGPAVAELDHLTGPMAPPLVRRFYPPPVVDALRWLWDEREALFGALERLPRTLCHRDAHRRNLFARVGPDGVEQLVAIDWAYVGHGAVGEEVAGMVLSNLGLFEAPGITPQELDRACFAAYREGLRDAGWTGHARSVRLGYTAAALRYGLGLLSWWLRMMSDPALHPFSDQVFRRPRGEVVDAWADELWPFLLGLAEEARGLLHAGA